MSDTFFSDLLASIADRGRSLLRLRRGSHRAGSDRDLAELAEALLSERGEASGMALAGTILAGYEGLAAEGRRAFLHRLVDEFGCDHQRLGKAIEAYRADPAPKAVLDLHYAAEPRRQELIRRLNLAPGGTAALVRMREELLRVMREDRELAGMDPDFVHLFSSWFNPGFLVLRPIDWSTPANILEKIIRYEAVHEIGTWDDLRDRLAPPDRRCFAFFHPQLPDEPIIFIEVALTRGMSAQVQPLLDIRTQLGDTANADCAMFYSITNCQEGLRGISFGNQLIKQVVEDLKDEFPHIKRFATLSPIPGFRRWLEGEMRGAPLSPADAELLARLADPAWHLGEVPEPLQTLLMRLCAYYLLKAKSGLEPLDPVARFHLGNGAVLERLNWMGDVSEQGMQRSAGMMVNYVYWLDELERNHERYFRDHHVLASPANERLARECPLAAEKPA